MKADLGQLNVLITRYEKAQFTVNRRLTAMIRELMRDEITIDQYATLRYLRGVGVCTSTELADIFCVGKSSITAITSRLFDKHLIERQQDDKDRRVTLLRLTEEGRRAADLIETEIKGLIACLLAHFETDEAMAFIATYEKLARVVAQSAGDGEE
ncbi:MarR family winged helix-turn-helix transcriptional regulator [Paenibacillus sp. NPDC058071]|uniref:MarR family winged helix-turn-helix transcriptional regulator n=1 Tax=Paenibacillus sp. NPDC058071 TaxID=3346326 RepID=UPI0036DA98CA